jgi:hypothetical protein
MVDTEQAWRAVATYFRDPDAYSYYHNLAKQGLAYCYLLRTQEYEKALDPLKELADLGSRQPVFEAFGIAGLVVAHAKLGDDEAAYYENQRLSPDKRATLEEQAPRMADLLNDALDELANRTP